VFQNGFLGTERI